MDKTGWHYATWNKSEKDKYCMTTVLCGIKKKSDTEQTGGCQRCWGAGVCVYEMGKGSQR